MTCIVAVKVEQMDIGHLTWRGFGIDPRLEIAARNCVPFPVLDHALKRLFYYSRVCAWPLSGMLTRRGAPAKKRSQEALIHAI
jgi:hypothetical protein